MTIANIDKPVRQFAELLTAAWSKILALGRDFPNGAVDDWLEASWELLIERNLPRDVYLYPYNGGADCYDTSSRVFRPDVEPNHVVACHSASGIAIDALTGLAVSVPAEGFALEQLVSVNNPGAYDLGPVFDHVRVGDHVNMYVFRLSDVSFGVRPISPRD